MQQKGCSGYGSWAKENPSGNLQSLRRTFSFSPFGDIPAIPPKAVLFSLRRYSNHSPESILILPSGIFFFSLRRYSNHSSESILILPSEIFQPFSRKHSNPPFGDVLFLPSGKRQRMPQLGREACGSWAGRCSAVRMWRVRQLGRKACGSWAERCSAVRMWRLHWKGCSGYGSWAKENPSGIFQPSRRTFYFSPFGEKTGIPPKLF